MPQHTTVPGSSFVVLAGLGLLCATTGCGEPFPGELDRCGLTCPADGEGVAGGNASISGVANVDAFFSAVIDVDRAALRVSGSIRAELEGMAASLGIAGAGELALPELTAQVKAAIEAKLAASVSGGLQIEFQPAKCEADLDVTAKAAVGCDVEADPGMIEAKCDGTCEVSAEVAATCAAEGMLTCEGQALSFQCDGSCTGSCQLEAGARCGGTCNGSCDAECTVCSGGACNDMGGTITNCAGQCMGDCEGECKLEAGGSCEGRCEGSCEYIPGSGSCEANATAKCDVSGMAEVECEGKCEGSIEPPMVNAECQASVVAKAKAEIVCTPPALTVHFQFSGALQGDRDAQAEFKAWLEGFKGRFAGMIAAKAKLDFVALAAADLVAAGHGAVRASFDTALDGGVDFAATIGLACAIGELEAVGTMLGEAQGELTASADAFVAIGGAVGAGG